MEVRSSVPPWSPFVATVLLVLLTSSPALADDPPQVNHQAIPCTVPGAPFTVCAEISDDGL